MMWTRDEGIYLCKRIEKIAPAYGAHVALTGGLLYKDGNRKDCDIILYRIRQASEIMVDELFDKLSTIGIVLVARPSAWLFKATYNDKAIDFLFPEEDGTYPDAPSLGDDDRGLADLFARERR